MGWAGTMMCIKKQRNKCISDSVLTAGFSDHCSFMYFWIEHNVVLYVFQITILWLDREEARVPGDQVGEGLHQADEVKESQRGVWSAWPHPSDILMCTLTTWTKLTMSDCNLAFIPSEAHTHYSVWYSLIYFSSLLLPAKPQRKHDYHILKE